jgi:hypothetical protein
LRQKNRETHQNHFKDAEQEYSLFDQHLEVLLWDYQGDRLEFSKFEPVPLIIHRAEQDFVLEIIDFSARNALCFFDAIVLTKK